MRKIQILTLFVIFSFQCFGQFNLENNFVFGGNGLDEAKDIVVNSSKTALFIGARSFSSDGDLPGNFGGSDYWIMKRNIDGTLLWSNVYGGPGLDDLSTVMPHPDGGVIAFGTTRTSHGLFGTLLGLTGGWLIRTNNNGNMIDGKIFGGTITEAGIDAFRHPSGDITMVLEAGSSVLNGQVNNGVLDVWVVQVDASFNLKWTALLGGPGSDVPVAVTSDVNNNIYIASTSNSDLPGLDPNQGGNDIWVVKLSPDGIVLWQKSFGGSGEDIANDIIVHPDGYVYLLAHSSSSDGDFETNHGINDIWMMKMDVSDGDLLEQKNYGGSGNDYNAQFDLYGNEHLVISTSTTSTDIDLTGNKGFGDVWIFITDLEGNITQQMNYGGSLNDFAADIVTVNGVFHVLSSTLSTDKNVPHNTLGQQDLWYHTLNTQPELCNDQLMCLVDSTLNNHLFPPAEDVLLCVGGCTAGYGPGPDFIGGICPDFNNATAYFYVTTDTTADLLTLSVTSHEFNKPQIALLRSVNCITFQQIACAIGENGTVLLPYIDIDPLTTYVIAISDAEGNVGEFDLCASSIDVEFCNVTDRIFATSTSMGSPLSGPYLPGEEVQICYELTNWQKLECNGFQGLLPGFGPGWDPASFDFSGQPIQIDSMLIPVTTGYWAWYDLGEVRYNISNPVSGYAGGQGMPPGWYFTNTGDPPPTEGPDQTTGDINSCLPTPDVWKVCFTLQVVDNCESNLDCSVTMKTFSDGEIGINPSLACAYDQEEVFIAYMLCCLNPHIQLIQDFNICSGDTIVFQPQTNLLPPVTYSWTADPDPFIFGAASANGAHQFFQILGTTAAIPLKVRYDIFAQGNGCQTQTEHFEVSVLPMPTAQISSSGPVIICSGSQVTLNFQLTGTPPFAIELLRDNDFFANVLSESSFISINIDPVFSGRFRIGTFQDANCEGDGTGFVNITVNPVGTAIIDTTICEGGAFIVGTDVFTFPGSYLITLPNGAVNNCDSIVSLTLSIAPSITEDLIDTICNGDTLFVLGVPYTTSTDVTIEYTGPEGCPQFIHLQLDVRDTFAIDINQTICHGDTLEFEGILVYQTGSYSHVKEIRPGCFEETILNLTVLPALSINDLEIMGDNGLNNGAILVEITGGSPPYTFQWSSGQLTESLFNIQAGSYSLTVTDQQGCRNTFNFEVPMISSSTELEKDLSVLKVWPTLVNLGESVRIYNPGTVTIGIKSVQWHSSEGRFLNRTMDEILLDPGSGYDLKSIGLFPSGMYYVGLTLMNGNNIWSKVVVR